jgi:iron complex outermembrane receptor protein
MRNIRLTYLIYFALIAFIITGFASSSQAQTNLALNGTVTDGNGKPLPGATVVLGEKVRATTTDVNGHFALKNLQAAKYLVSVSFVGYHTVEQPVVLKADKTIAIMLIPETLQLEEVSVKGNREKTLKQEDSRNVEVVSSQFMHENQMGSLMQTLSRMPGVSSIDIGSGQSKPVIRGLSCNRVAVAENGIKHEAQEWGADHGLEIDQYAVERIEVVKGPASLVYGSNAIGGVIDLKQLAVPAKNTSGGSLDLNARSNNNLLGGSALFFTRGNKFYLKSRLTYTAYADYKVPTDSIEYLSYYFKLKDRLLRNTAGNEINGNFTSGYVTNGFSTHLTVSDFFSKSGFFANAHGLEIRTSSIDYDRSSRDIDLPFQQVNHLKILSNTNWAFSGYLLHVDMAYQNNFRKEFAEATSHGYMPIPPDTLERRFRKDTGSLNAKLEFPSEGIHRFTAGINTEYQHNTIGGWGFILPAFKNLGSGAFLYDKMKLSDRWVLNAGMRFDYGSIETEAYTDWYATPKDDGTKVYVQRAAWLKRTFSNLTWAVGANYNADPFSVKINIGKSFRMPIAKELASNGVNYHMYRYEKGDSTLQSEISYQIDLGISWVAAKWNVELTPFANYFPNYIYLNPTSKYHEGLQIYYHRESEVFRAGGELSANVELVRSLTAGLDAEYIYSEQLSGEKRGFTLPFSPPFSSVFSLKFTPSGNNRYIKPAFTIEYKLVADQNEIVPPEKKTAGYRLVNLMVSSGFRVGKQALRVQVQAQNLFNTKYYDHTSFYRLIEVPGPGRNISLSVHIPINKEL